MNRYRQLKEYFREILEFRDHKIYDVEHSISRYLERIGKDIFLYNKLLKRGINWLIENKKEHIEDRYVFVSKKYKFGIQVEWRKDRYNKTFNGYTATTFSEKEMKILLHNDKKIFLENKEKYINKGLLNENNFIWYEFNKNLNKEMKLIDYNIFLENNKVFKTFEIVDI